MGVRTGAQRPARTEPAPTPRSADISGALRHADDQRLRLRVLGGFELLADGETVALPLNARRLIAFLAIRERPQLRQTIACTLWLDMLEARAAANLRTTLWKLGQSNCRAVRVSGDYLAISPEADVDLGRLLAQARRLIGPAEGLSAEDADATSLCGDLLPDWDEDWIQFERERLRQLRIHALESLCRRLSLAGRHAEAVDAGQAAVCAEPLRESAQRTLIESHLAEGNMCEALRQFEIYREVLWDALRLLPSPDLQRMVMEPSAASRTTASWSRP
jgi:DNA-binding SARP family transcriptional activator